MQIHEKHENTAKPSLQFLFHEPLTTKVQWKTAIISTWINLWGPILEQSYTTALEMGYLPLRKHLQLPNYLHLPKFSPVTHPPRLSKKSLPLGVGPAVDRNT